MGFISTFIPTELKRYRSIIKSTENVITFSAVEIVEKNESKEAANWPSSNPRFPGWIYRSLPIELNR